MLLLIRVMKNISNKFQQGALAIIIAFIGYFCRQSQLNLKNVAQRFQVSIYVHLCHPLQQMTGNSFNA